MYYRGSQPPKMTRAELERVALHSAEVILSHLEQREIEARTAQLVAEAQNPLRRAIRWLGLVNKETRDALRSRLLQNEIRRHKEDGDG